MASLILPQSIGNGPARGVPGLWVPGRIVMGPTDDAFGGLALGSWWTVSGLTATVNDKCSIVSASHNRMFIAASYGTAFGTTWSIKGHFKNHSGTVGMAGLCIVDGSGNGAGYSLYNDGNTYMWGLTAWAYASTGPNNGGQPSSAEYWLELRKNGATTYAGRYTTDPAGATGWTSFTSNLTRTDTPTYIGWVEALSGVVSVDFIRWQVTA